MPKSEGMKLVQSMRLEHYNISGLSHTYPYLPSFSRHFDTIVTTGSCASRLSEVFVGELNKVSDHLEGTTAEYTYV